MADQYLIIQTRDPFESAGLASLHRLATDLAATADVTVLLAENGVLGVRKDSSVAPTVSALAASVGVWADEFSLRERGIRDDELAAGVHPSSLDPVVDLIADPACKVFWN